MLIYPYTVGISGDGFAVDDERPVLLPEIKKDLYMATVNETRGSNPVDAAAYFGSDPAAGRRDLSGVAANLIASEILKIGTEVRAMQAAGKPVLNLTIGDFSPKEFPIPQALTEAAVRAF